MFIRDDGIIIHLFDENGWKYIKILFRPVINEQNNGARVNERVLRIVVLLKTVSVHCSYLFNACGHLFTFLEIKNVKLFLETMHLLDFKAICFSNIYK